MAKLSEADYKTDGWVADTTVSSDGKGELVYELGMTKHSERDCGILLTNGANGRLQCV